MEEGLHCELTMGHSIRARAVTVAEPRMVPRIVCGRRNFQKACRNAAAFCRGVRPLPSCAECPSAAAAAAAAIATTQARRSRVNAWRAPEAQRLATRRWCTRVRACMHNRKMQVIKTGRTLGAGAACRLGCQNGRGRGIGAQLWAWKGVRPDTLAPEHLDGGDIAHQCPCI